MQYSIIQKSQLEGANRLDAEYFVTNQVFKEYYLGSEIVNFVQYGTSKDLNEEGRGYPTLRLNEFDSYFVKEPEKYCNRINQQQFLDLELKKNDILVCRTNGNPKLVGKSAIVIQDRPYAFASYLFRIRTNSEKINPSTLIAYLHSSFGRVEIEKNMMISNQTNFSPARFKLIRIPKFAKVFQDVIDGLILSAYDLSNKSGFYYNQAENLLLGELELSDFDIPQDLSYIVNFSEVKNANRVDAEYFQPKYEQVLKVLKQKGVFNLGSQFEVIKSKTFDYKEDGEVGVIKTKQLGKQFINFEVESKTSKDVVVKENLPKIKNGDILFASMGVGSLGKTNMYYDFEIKSNEFTIDSTLRILRNKTDYLPEGLAVYLNSNIGQELIYKYIVGSSGIISIYDTYLESFPIPVLTKPTQQKIADLVKMSHEARKKSKQLLEEAKKKSRGND